MNQRNSQPRFEDRVRFNWGFHDGQQAQTNGWNPAWARGEHHDSTYEAGYWMGRAHVEQHGAENPTSDAAWAAHQAAA